MNILEKIGFKGEIPVKRASALRFEPAASDEAACLYTEESFLNLEATSRLTIGSATDGRDFDALYCTELMLHHIYKRAQGNGWFSETVESDHIRVAMRTSPSEQESMATYLTAPHVEQEEEDECITLLDLAGYLQCGIIMAMSSKITSMILRHLPPTIKRVPLGHSTRIQVIDTYEDFMSIRKAQSATFVRENSSLIIWTQDVHEILQLGHDLEEKIVNMIWDENYDLEKGPVSAFNEGDPEKSDVNDAGRSVSNMTPIIVATAIMATAVFIGTDLHEVVLQIKADDNYRAIAILIYFPIMLWLAAFFAQIFASMVLQLLGPISHLTKNSKYYSAIPPIRSVEHELPHITVQCPVYEEDLDMVLAPALHSVKEAVKTYEMQGGTANIFVNDDGIDALSPADKIRRIAFYSQNDIGWIARPMDGQGGFVRAGKFKKASNMNFCLDIAYKLEQRLALVERHNAWSENLENLFSQNILTELLAQQHPPAQGCGNIRIGDLILLIDADTRIPSDCFLDAAYEFHNSPEIAILQHTSHAFQVIHNYWEDCMAHFTLFVSEAMRYMTAGGDVCPFVGHNAFLRWSAIQEVGIETEGKRRWWSESHVSEDFEMSIRLQDLGYCIRMASYAGGEFKEGVSLTVYDEFARWQKYAYGISELCFNPIRYWVSRGPFTKLFKDFLKSKRINAASKFTMLAYMGSYYAIASMWLLSVINYFIIGWSETTITKLYQSAFQLLIANLVVFDAAMPVVNAIHRYRTRNSPFFFAVYQNFKWILLISIFFGGLSMHVTQSLLWHLLGLPLHWEATSKSLESSYFLKEIPMIWRRYKIMYCLIFAFSVACIILTTHAIPENWRILPSIVTGLPIGWVLACHALSPLLLNPQSWLSELHM